ncbi:MAG TPA: nuclear transport factor 2 family protein [Thermoanaerobaculia bacterium]|jgi:ketosteroid isomerase-like protein|nr:nuclear transport factor 2 family protein [Thermoanaerobaculia bacterium]
MSARDLPRSASEDASGVIAANGEFYAALDSRDGARMEALWSHAEDVACIHPGWHRLDGWEDVSQSWRAIFANSRPWKVRAEEEHVFVSGEIAVVLCVEVLEASGASGEPARMQATNVFRLEEGAWRIVHHHASPMPEAGEEEEEPVN